VTNDKRNDRKVICSEHILKVLKHADQALNYADFGSLFSYGTLRNEMSKLVKNGKILKLPKESVARFILPEWAHRPEYSCIQRNDKKGRVGRFDFLSYLEGLNWERALGVHDLRLSFAVYQLHWAGSGWKYCRRSRSYSRRLDLSYPVKAQCFDTGTVLVSVKCSSKPFPLDIEGLVALSNLLGEVRNALRAPCIPDPATWRIVQWHLNRDSEKLQGGGLDVYLTFRDFFGDSAQFYYKRSLERVRAEVNQSPKRTIQEVFENILNRDNVPEKGDFQAC
jgi:hypothetical protein